MRNRIVLRTNQNNMKEIKCYCGHTITCDCEPLKKQTAVEWLFEILDVVDSSISFVYFEQAKEMEKEQMNNFFKNGIEYGFDSYHANVLAEEPTRPNFEQYYNENFKSE